MEIRVLSSVWIMPSIVSGETSTGSTRDWVYGRDREAAGRLNVGNEE
jgi:hypothetical protein